MITAGTSNNFHSESSESQHKKARLAIEIDDSKDLFEEFITPWLICSGIYLYEHDKSILRSDKLSDCHIDFAQFTLKKQFPSTAGLMSTLLMSALRCKQVNLTKNSLFLQIVHSRDNHWLVLFTKYSSSIIYFYDSQHWIVTHNRHVRNFFQNITL